MNNKLSIKKTLKYCFISFLTTLSFTMEYKTILEKNIYESSLAYYSDRLVESFFSYQFYYYLLIPFFFFAYVYIDQKTEELRKTSKLLSLFFSIALVFGKSFRQTNSWDFCFLDIVSLIKTTAAIVGFYFIIQAVMRLLYKAMQKPVFEQETKQKSNKLILWLFNENIGMIKTMFRLSVFILILWLPILILCYPGGSCVDVSYQIEQVLGNTAFSTQQSIFHTLFLGLWLKIGETLFYSYNIGLYIGIFIQTCLFIFVLSYSLYRLMGFHVKKSILLTILIIYIATPLYSNLATMAIKDTLFSAAILWFVVELMCLLFTTKCYLKNKKRYLSFILSAVFVTLFRNNGIYVIALSLIVLAIYFIRKKINIRAVLVICVLPILAFFLLSNFLVFATQATTTSSKEMLSIPFQQTGRYMTKYENEITETEIEALNAVFEDVGALKTLYDPNISDPIKRSYREAATAGELISYIKTWFTMGIRHPGIYMEAFLNHCYGWFDPGSNNWIRYEGRMPIFTTPKYLGTPDKIMYYVYNFLNRLPILGLLENVGIFVWGMLFATIHLIEKKEKKLLLAFVPLYVSLLVCIASPAFWLHPRYAFPIILCMPFLWVAMQGYINKEGLHEF